MPHSLEALTFKQASERYPGFTENGFRWMRFNGDENGFNTCLIKLGRRVLLIPALFERWLETHRVANAESEDWAAARVEELERELERLKAARAAKKPKRSGLTRPQVGA